MEAFPLSTDGGATDGPSRPEPVAKCAAKCAAKRVAKRTAKRAAGNIGRPRRGSEGEATRRILDAAIPIFLADGYETASIDAIAVAAGASKKTFYAKFTSKADLFEAVCLRLIERYLPPIEKEAVVGGSTASCLHRIALAVLEVGLTPDGIALRRIIAAESVRFPEFARTLHDFGHSRLAPMIARCLEEGVERGELVVGDVRFAADYFIDAAIQPPMNRAMFGLEHPELTQGKREALHATVEMFLRAYSRPGTSRPLPAPGHGPSRALRRAASRSPRWVKGTSRYRLRSPVEP